MTEHEGATPTKKRPGWLSVVALVVALVTGLGLGSVIADDSAQVEDLEQTLAATRTDLQRTQDERDEVTADLDETVTRARTVRRTSHSHLAWSCAN